MNSDLSVIKTFQDNENRLGRRKRSEFDSQTGIRTLQNKFSNALPELPHSMIRIGNKKIDVDPSLNFINPSKRKRNNNSKLDLTAQNLNTESSAFL